MMGLAPSNADPLWAFHRIEVKSYRLISINQHQSATDGFATSRYFWIVPDLELKTNSSISLACYWNLESLSDALDWSDCSWEPMQPGQQMIGLHTVYHSNVRLYCPFVLVGHFIWYVSEIPANDTRLTQTLYDFSPGSLASQLFRSSKHSAHVWVHWYPIDLTHALTMEIPRFEKVLVLLSHGLLKLIYSSCLNCQITSNHHVLMRQPQMQSDEITIVDGWILISWWVKPSFPMLESSLSSKWILHWFLQGDHLDVLKKRAPALYSVWGHQGSPRITVVPLRWGISHDSTIEVSEFVRKLMNLAYSLDFVSPGNILKIDHCPRATTCLPYLRQLAGSCVHPLFSSVRIPTFCGMCWLQSDYSCNWILWKA